MSQNKRIVISMVFDNIGHLILLSGFIFMVLDLYNAIVGIQDIPFVFLLGIFLVGFLFRFIGLRNLSDIWLNIELEKDYHKSQSIKGLDKDQLRLGDMFVVHRENTTYLYHKNRPHSFIIKSMGNHTLLNMYSLFDGIVK